jgi:L-fucose mutarotase
MIRDVLKTSLLHPEISMALGAAGHGSRVLIADGNYPFSTESGAAARKVFLNLRPGLVSVTDVLETLVQVIPIESALLMAAPEGVGAPLHETIRQLLPPEAKVSAKKRTEFYGEVLSPATALVIATGEQRRFANVLLTIGVVVSEMRSPAISPPPPSR